MNLGLTGPLNPSRPGNAVLGARLLRSPPAVGRERPGRRSFVAAAGPADRGGGGGLLASGAPDPPTSPRLSPAPAVRSPAFVLSSRGSRRGSGGAGGRGCAPVPGTGAARRLPAPRGSAWRGALRGRDAEPHAERRDARGDRGSGPWQLVKELALKFRGGVSCPVAESLYPRVRRAVPGVCGRRDLGGIPDRSGRVPPPCARKVLTRFPHSPCAFLQSDLFNFL